MTKVATISRQAASAIVTGAKAVKDHFVKVYYADNNGLSDSIYWGYNREYHDNWPV